MEYQKKKSYFDLVGATKKFRAKRTVFRCRLDLKAGALPCGRIRKRLKRSFFSTSKMSHVTIETDSPWHWKKVWDT